MCTLGLQIKKGWKASKKDCGGKSKKSREAECASTEAEQANKGTLWETIQNRVVTRYIFFFITDLIFYPKFLSLILKPLEILLSDPAKNC